MEHKKDTTRTEITSRNFSGSMTVFGTTVSKKSERLATAVYLVTGFLSDTEPIKFRLRTLSLELVRDSVVMKSGNQIVEANIFEVLRANIFETLSLLELAFMAGLVSEMNFTILKREYVSLRDLIEIKKASRESRTDNILGDNFFSIPNSESLRSDFKSLNSKSDLYSSTLTSSAKGHSIGQPNTTVTDRNNTPTYLSRTDTKVQSQKPTVINVLPQHTRAVTDIAKESRRTRILKLIKDNREVTIKDIATHFPDLSEKTIQRELVAMSDSGVLKRAGERRWSRYSLA